MNHDELVAKAALVVKAWDEALPGVDDITRIDIDLLLAMGSLKLAIWHYNRREDTVDDIRYWVQRASPPEQSVRYWANRAAALAQGALQSSDVEAMKEVLGAIAELAE